jgi:rSAM/selenodomain-associated transferase 2
MLSVIVPTLNAAATLPRTLGCLIGPTARGLVREVIIADGGSTDATREIADATGATFLQAPTGRGTQLRAGAAAARHDWLLFLHADTVPEDSWEREVMHYLASSLARERAGVFAYALDDFSPGARRLETIVRLRNKLLALPYGDQGLLISRHLYNNVGGFADMALMEDVDMARRLGRKRLVFFRSKAVTSATRYKEDGYLSRPLRNTLVLSLYFLRVPTHLLVRLYG